MFEPNLYCSKCLIYVAGGYKGFQIHLKRPDHVPPFVCGQAECSNDFMHRRSLFEHIRHHHSEGEPNRIVPAPLHDENLVVIHEAGDDDMSDDGEVDHVDVALNVIEEPREIAGGPLSLAQSAERAVLKFRGVTYMTGAAIQIIEKEAYSLMQGTASHLKWHVESYLDKMEKTEDDKLYLLQQFDLPDPFKHVKTKKQQMNVFKERYGLIQPEEIFLYHSYDARLHPRRPQLEARQVPRSFQFVSVKAILRCVLLNPHYRSLIMSEKPSTDGYIRSFLDGSLYETLPPHLKSAIRIVLYIDDLEIVQALSPTAGNYKVAGMYFGIQNLPAEVNSLLTNIFVTALAYADDAKREKVWEPVLGELKELETSGMDLEIEGEVVNFKAVLVSQIGDSLAASEVLGLRGPSASKFCRVCYITRPEMWEDGTKVGECRTPEKHAADVLAAARGEAYKKATGVNGPPMIKGLTFFQPIGHSIFDIFHDLLQGINKMEIKLALRYYVHVKKYFDVPLLNSRVGFFDYGYPDQKNKPLPKFTLDYLKSLKSYNLHQTGSQVWCLTRAFPFLFGDLVPSDDPHMALISFLNQIMTIVFSRAVKNSDLNELHGLIYDHHKLFMEIYSGQPEQEETTEQPDENVAEENIDNPDEEEDEAEGRCHGFVDFFDSEDEAEAEDDPVVATAAPAAGNAGQGRRKKRPKIIRMINKHHHLWHYIQMILQCGPMILYWCARHEARHFLFKLCATVCHNFKNVLKTLMEQLQMKLAAEKADPPNRIKVGKRGTKLVTVESTPHSELLQCAGIEAFSKVYEVRHVTCDGVDFRPLLFVTTALRQVGSHPVFARIENIYVTQELDTVYLLLKEWKTECFAAKYCAYEVTPQAAAVTTIKKPSDLPMHRAMTIWKRYDSNKLYLAPRTIG